MPPLSSCRWLGIGQLPIVSPSPPPSHGSLAEVGSWDSVLAFVRPELPSEWRTQVTASAAAAAAMTTVTTTKKARPPRAATFHAL